MRRAIRFQVLVFAGLAITVFGATSYAQLSPGELHKSHAFLEGVQNCSKCHGSDRQLVPDKCLACHAIIRDHLVNHSGLHGSQEYNQCQLCHVEHQGRDYELVYWKDGQRAFDHALTGYTLDGKHVGLDCRSCHVEKFIADRAVLDSEKVILARTFLGLNRACRSCHLDEHRGQVSSACTDCHTTIGWKPATGFDHSTSGYALLGRHTTVLCAKCHPVQKDGASADDGQFLKFRPLSHDQCTDCHADAHGGKLGANCRNCHSPDGWQVTDKAKFDHSRTRYPLEGMHASVTCDKCHLPSRKGAELKFATCRDCHSDFHQGAFAARPQEGACEECHTVSGYKPARFLMAQHDDTKYPLKGAHRAIMCLACHIKNTGLQGTPVYQFRFEATKCMACHNDPHRGELQKYVSSKGCEACHSEASWAAVTFDHAQTQFLLEGKHAPVPCRKCHTGAVAGIAEPALTFVRTSRLCQDCHADEHRGQFAASGTNSTDCARCHRSQSWRAVTFDHVRQSRFALDGAHKSVPCGRCHRPAQVDSARYVIYRPLDTACSACHGAATTLEKEKKS